MQIPPFIVSCQRIPRRQAYYVKFSINDQLIERIKALPHESRKWNSGNNSWELTTKSLLAIIKIYKGSTKIYFDFGSEDSRKVFISQIKKIESVEFEKQKAIKILNQNKENWIKFKLELEKNYENYSDYVHSFLKEGTKLYKHQIVGIMFANEVRNILISNEMGLGKTLQSIGYVEMNKFEKVIVITPNSLKYNFLDEVNSFTNSKAHIINWKKNKYTIEESKYIIVNYEYFNSGNKNYSDDKWNKLNIKKINCLICDESHRLKSSSVNTFKNIKRIFKTDYFENNLRSMLFLSGTPCPNAAYELYTVLNEICPLDFPTKEYFMKYYCGMTYNVDGWGYTTDTAEAKLEELFYKIAAYTYRKRKIDVLDLPDKIYQKIILELDNNEQKIYDDLESGVVNEFTNTIVKNPLTVMLRLRQYVSLLKVKHVKDFVDNILNSGEKIIIVNEWKESLRELKKIFGDIAGLHDGDISADERNKIIKEFRDKDSKMKILLGTIKTVKEGLNLTIANKIILLSQPFSPGEYDQISDRTHRINQLKNVYIFPLVFRETIDEYVFSIVEKKRVGINKVMDNEDYVSNIKESVISEVINKLKEKHNKK